MNRISFHEEDGALQTYWEEVTPVEKEKAAAFVLKDKPVYLQIFFHRPLDEEEIRILYSIVRDHQVVDMTDEQCENSIKEDMECQPMGTWEFRCENFTNVFNCACDIGLCDFAWDGSITFQISDEPTALMKKWLDNKKVEKNIAASLKKLVDKNRYVEVGKGVEKHYGVTRERFNKALKRLQDEGYHITIISFKDKEPACTRILSRDVLCKGEILANRDKWKKERERNVAHESESDD